MRILHTSDWHLGQKFLQNDRHEEHQQALDWVLEVIQKEKVDLLIVSGDIFDIGNPPFPARKQYYQFLTKLLNTSCRFVVVTGGNHDAPGMLDAPKELLSNLNIFVVGAAPENPEDACLALRDKSGKLEAVVAAVPFLRDRDLRYAIAGETSLERLDRMRLAIRRYFERMGELASGYANAGVPIILTGHLYVTGAQASDRQDNIYIGDVENIEAAAFPKIFDYVALGHIHRPQIVAGIEHVRYSGSLIPLSFNETKDEKGCYLIDLQENTNKTIRFIVAPEFRRLKTIKGSLEEVKAKLTAFAAKERPGLRSWVEIAVETDRAIPQLDAVLREYASDMDLDILKIQLKYLNTPGGEVNETEELNNLDALEVFRNRCRGFDQTPEEIAELEKTFIELQTWMQDHSLE